MEPIHDVFDITDAMPEEVSSGQRLCVASWTFLPPIESILARKPTIVSLLHGGSYDKRYFHPGPADYSTAQCLCEAGNVVFLTDVLGAGESSRSPNPQLVTRSVAATANHFATLKFYERIQSGNFHKALPALSEFTRVGGGHSMGAMLTITQQAQHRSYECVMVLGYTALTPDMGDASLESVDRGAISETSLDYILIDRRALRSIFYWPDVPDTIVTLDDSLLVDLPYLLATQARTPGIVAEDAALIDVPLFICLGESDVSPNPWAEPDCYRNANDITLLILPRSAHCHAFSGSRKILGWRMQKWMQDICEPGRLPTQTTVSASASLGAKL